MGSQLDTHAAVQTPSPPARDHAAVLTADLLRQLRRESARMLPMLARTAKQFVAVEAWKHFGFANVHDFSRERLDYSGRWLRNLARTGIAIEEIAELECAVSGDDGKEPLSRTAAFEISRVATKQSATRWISYARRSTIRQLKRLVQVHLESSTAGGDAAAGGSSPASDQTATSHTNISRAHPDPTMLSFPVPAYVATTFELLERVFMASNPGCSRSEYLDAMIAEFTSTGIASEAVSCELGERLQQQSQRLNTKAPHAESHLLDAPCPEDTYPVEPQCFSATEQDLDEGALATIGTSAVRLGQLHKPDRVQMKAMWSLQRTRQFHPPSTSNEGRVSKDQLLHTLQTTLEIERHLDIQISLLLHWLESRSAWWALGFENGTQFSDSVLQESGSTFRNRVRLAKALETSRSLRDAHESGALSRQRVLRIVLIQSRFKIKEAAIGQWADHASDITLKRLDDEIRLLCSPDNGDPSPVPPTDNDWFSSLHFGPGEARHRILAGSLDALRAMPAANVFLKLRGTPETICALRLCLRQVRHVLAEQSLTSNTITPAEAARLKPSLRLATSLIRRNKSLPDWLCLLTIMEEFAEEYDNPKHIVRRPTDTITNRDGWRCTAPGCTARSLEVHHVVYQSNGGSNEKSNLTTLCPFHHRMGEHGTLASVNGTAPLNLSWTLGGAQNQTSYRNERVIVGPR